MRRVLPSLVIAVALAAPAAGRAESAAPLTFEIDKERTTDQKILIASFGGGVLLFAGIGALFHLDSKHKSDEISASGNHTGKIYDQDVDDTRSDALRSRGLTIASYGVAGALLVTTFVLYVVTDPGTETITLDEGRAAWLPTVEPVAGGAIAGARWGF